MRLCRNYGYKIGVPRSSVKGFSSAKLLIANSWSKTDRYGSITQSVQMELNGTTRFVVRDHHFACVHCPSKFYLIQILCAVDNMLVSLQGTEHTETLITMLTQKGFFPSVNTLVCPQVS